MNYRTGKVITNSAHHYLHNLHFLITLQSIPDSSYLNALVEKSGLSFASIVNVGAGLCGILVHRMLATLAATAGAVNHSIG